MDERHSLKKGWQTCQPFYNPSFAYNLNNGLVQEVPEASSIP
jgi:hypothetical protein